MTRRKSWGVEEPWDPGSLWCPLSLGKPSETFSDLARSLFLEMSLCGGPTCVSWAGQREPSHKQNPRSVYPNDFVTHAEDHGREDNPTEEMWRIQQCPERSYLFMLLIPWMSRGRGSVCWMPRFHGTPAISGRGRQTQTPESGSAVGASVCAGGPVAAVLQGGSWTGTGLGGRMPVPFLRQKQHFLTHVAYERVDL